jgi:hypothetical protein
MGCKRMEMPSRPGIVRKLAELGWKKHVVIVRCEVD